MNTALVISKINGALNVLRIIETLANKLPKRWQRELPVAGVVGAIRGLEIAKAELQGQPWPDAPTPTPVITGSFDPSEFIEQ